MPDSPQMFHDWLEDHARGTLNDELTLALAEIVDACSTARKPASLTLRLDVSTSGDSGRMVVIAGRVKTKVPEPAAEQSIFFVGEGGSLHRDDPYAKPFPGLAKKVDPATGEVTDGKSAAAGE